MKRLIAACLGFGSLIATASASEQLLFTKGVSKSGASLALDYMSDGKAVGLQIEILAPSKGQLDFLVLERACRRDLWSSTVSLTEKSSPSSSMIRVSPCQRD